MALIICPECQNQISSFAVLCPQCGYPLSEMKNNAEEKFQSYIYDSDKTNLSGIQTGIDTGSFYIDDKNIATIHGDSSYSQEESSDMREDFVKINNKEIQGINMVDPNVVNSLNRKETLAILNDICIITAVQEEYIDKIHEVQVAIDTVNQTVKMIEMRSFWLNVPVQIGIWFTNFCICIFGRVNIIVVVVLVVITVLVIKYPLKTLFKNLANNKNREEAETYLNQEMPQLQKELKERMCDLEQFNQTPEVAWAQEIIAPDIFSTDIVLKLIEYIESHRADSLKEALNKLDSDVHTYYMETMQDRIAEFSQQTAEEATKQTAFAQQTAKNAFKVANNTERIYRIIKKM